MLTSSRRFCDNCFIEQGNVSALEMSNSRISSTRLLRILQHLASLAFSNAKQKGQVCGKRLNSKVSTFWRQTEGWTNRKERKPEETASIICLAVVWLSKGKQWKQDCMKLQPELLRCIISKMPLSSCYWNAKCGVACCKEENHHIGVTVSIKWINWALDWTA